MRAGALLAATLLLAGCAADPSSVAGQAKDGSDKNYVSQDGGIEHLAVGKRAAPVALTGSTLDGSRWSVADAAGKVVVLNVWGSWCPPCVKEQPELVTAYQRLRAAHPDVVFMGVNNRDSVTNAKAFVTANAVPYPSLADDGTTMAALQGLVPAPPVTLVLDRQGRVAGRITGETTAATLTALVEDVVKDPA